MNQELWFKFCLGVLGPREFPQYIWKQMNKAEDRRSPEGSARLVWEPSELSTPAPRRAGARGDNQALVCALWW